MKRKDKRRVTPKRCKATAASGKPCGAYAQLGQDVCHFHGKDLKKAAAKGGKVTSAVKAEIDSVLERCNLMSTKSQARFMNMALVLEWEGERRYKAICAYMGHLITLTKESDPTQKIEVSYTVTPPEGSK